MTEFGIDIDEDILIRLEPNDLIRCKSVCKSWYSLISTPRFVKSHLNRHSGDARIVVSKYTTSTVDYSYSRGCRLVGSSNGLVCLLWNSSYYNDFLVVNPCTREVKKLVNNIDDYNEVHIYATGFGYDSSIDDFKVVIGHLSLPNDELTFDVLELKKNIWRSVAVEWDDYDPLVGDGMIRDGAYDCLVGDGILCNGAIHWLYPNNLSNDKSSVLVSFDLSKEVFKTTPLPELDKEWTLGTMRDRLCILRVPNKNIEEIEIWVMRNYQVSWERKSVVLPPGYVGNQTTMDYIPNKNFLSGQVHIWLSEEGSGAPVLVRSIDHPHSENIGPHDQEHVWLSTYSDCNYDYFEHVFVKSLVSPHGMGNEKRVERKRREKERESFVFHGSHGGRAKCKRQSLASYESNGDGRRVERTWRERENHVFHGSEKGRSCYSNHDGRRLERKWRERESHVSHGSDKGRSSESNRDGRRVERRWRERDSHVFHGSDKGRSSDSNHDGRRVEMKWREKESHVFHTSDKGRAASKSQSLVSFDSNHDGRRVERK